MPPPTIPVRSTGLTSYLSGSIKKILLAHSKTFLCIQPHLLSIPGGSDDWAKGGAGIKYSFTVELPDTGRHGFILPPRYSFTVELLDTRRHGFILPPWCSLTVDLPDTGRHGFILTPRYRFTACLASGSGYRQTRIHPSIMQVHTVRKFNRYAIA